MSAFMVTKAHIDALVLTAIYGPNVTDNHRSTGSWYGPSHLRGKTARLEDADGIGRMLMVENLHSIHARYPQTITNPDSTPGPEEQYWKMEYTFPQPDFPAKLLTPIRALKTLICYEYQACEHPEWDDSQAKCFCSQMKDSLIARLPGYDEAPWEIETIN